MLHLGLMVEGHAAYRTAFGDDDFFGGYLGDASIKGTYHGMFPGGWVGMVPGPAKKPDGQEVFTNAAGGYTFPDPNPLDRVDPTVTKPVRDGLRKFRFKDAAYAALLPHLRRYKALPRAAVDKKAFLLYLQQMQKPDKKSAPARGARARRNGAAPAPPRGRTRMRSWPRRRGASPSSKPRRRRGSRSHDPRYA